MAELTNDIERLLGDFSWLEPRIKHLSYNTEVCSERINVSCSYVTFRDGEVTFSEFIDAISSLIVPFCLPRSQIQEVRKKMLAADHVELGRLSSELHSKANRLFIKAKKGSHRSGEVGEILLYILNEWMLKAPQIISKMYLKTNNNMPVHGTDGIHARYDKEKEKLVIYWGESKCHKTLESGLTDALKSIKEFIDSGHEKREIDIIHDHLDADSMDEEALQAFLKYLDPYTKESQERITTFSCLLVFDESGLIDNTCDPEKTEQAFVDKLNTAAEKFISSINGRVNGVGLGAKRFEFFLVPVPSVQKFRDSFQSKIGWPND